MLAIATATLVPVWRTSRSVRPLASVDRREPAKFDREQSAGLFVGVRLFTNDATLDVPYAVDDAIGLAYMFVLDRRVHLIPPDRVVLALSGQPEKPEARRQLRELKRAGVQIRSASREDILSLLQQQAALAGRDGILIVSLATHGFVDDGVPYILGATSLFGHRETTLSVAKLCDIAASSRALRSLILVDACRQRINARGALPTLPAAPIIRRMQRVQGQVIFYAGEYAYDDIVNRNGVFTKAIIDGLSCKATATRGVVTAGTLRTYVEREVREWIRKHRDPSIGAAIQVSMDGSAHTMPLSLCWQPPGPVPVEAFHVVTNDSVITAIASNGRQLWQADAGGSVLRAETADLDGDGPQEVVTGLRDRIVVLDSEGHRLWSAATGMTLRTFKTADLFRKHRRELVALWFDEHSAASRLSIHDNDGRLLSAYDDPGPLEYLAIDRPTTRHAPKIIVAGGNHVFLFHRDGTRLWHGMITPLSETIERLQVVDYDNDAQRDIAVSTKSGNTFYLDFEGELLERRSAKTAVRARFVLLHGR